MENNDLKDFLEKKLDPILNTFFARNQGNRLSNEMVIGLKYFLIKDLASKWQQKQQTEVAK